jgi:hypothetical protein
MPGLCGGIMMKSIEIEIAVANHIGCRQYLIVPNISWGMGLHECDLLVCTKANYLWEVEIKVSKADLKKDREKLHGHHNKKIKRLYFAIPEKLYNEECLSYIPERAGIFIVKELNDGRHFVILKRAPKPNKNAQPITEKEKSKMAELGAMRIWSLKRKLLRLKTQQ